MYRTMSFRGIGTAPGFSRRYKTPPPHETGQESSYLKSLGERQTPVTVKLVSGEKVYGWIEYYDLNMIRITRQNQPNLFIFKHQVLYISEDSGRRR